LVLFLVHPWRLSIVLPIAAFVAATAAIFVAYSFLVFGPDTLQLSYFTQLFSGMLYYGVWGWNGAPISWTLSEWNWLYNLVAPGTMLATLAAIMRASSAGLMDQKRAAVLAFLSVSGLLLLTKYVNQSVAGVWQMSAIGPISAIGWWCVALLDHIKPTTLRWRVYFESPKAARPYMQITTSLRSNAALVMIILALIFVYSPSDRRNPPGLYGLRAWAAYPSLLKWPLLPPGGCVRMECVADRPENSDLTLIESRTRPEEQVAIVGGDYDWTYLIGAHRPPLMFFLPSSYIFSEEQVQESRNRLKNQQFIFTPTRADKASLLSFVDEISNSYLTLDGTRFERNGEGERLIAWKRTAPSDLPEAR
jgi:hypothetical protein